MATSGDFLLATDGDFLMAMDSRVRSTCCPIQPGIAHPAFGRILRTPICCTSARNASAPSQPNPSARPGPSGPGDPVSSFLNARVANTAAFYADAKSKGAQLLTEQPDREAETRCYRRDPDG